VVLTQKKANESRVDGGGGGSGGGWDWSFYV